MPLPLELSNVAFRHSRSGSQQTYTCRFEKVWARPKLVGKQREYGDDSVKTYRRGYHIEFEVSAGQMERSSGPDRDMIQLWLDLTSGDAVAFSPNPDEASPTWFNVTWMSGGDPDLLYIENGTRMADDVAQFRTTQRLSETDLQLFQRTTN